MTWLSILSVRVLHEPRHVVAGVRLLVFAGLAVLGYSARLGQPFAFWIMTIVYGLTVFGTLVAKNAEHALPRVRMLLFLFDVSMIGCLIVVRGYQVQGLVMACAVLLLLAAVLVDVGNFLLNALVASAFYIVVTHWGQSPAALLTLEHAGPVSFLILLSVFLGHVAATTRAASPRTHGGRAAARYASALGETTTKLRESTFQLREARETLRANERLFTLGMLSAGIAHEIKNPVAAILASVNETPEMLDEMEEALREGRSVSDLITELRGVADDCRHAGRQLQRIALDLGNMVRGGTAQIRTLEPEEALQGAVRMLRPAAGDTVRIEVRSEATLRVHADPGRLMQILLNLAGNAIDAMGARGGGTVTLSTEDAGEDRIAFVVADTGPGIPLAVQERMYDPFYTTKGPGKGTGLGLHLVSEIVNAQQGTITCQSTPGEGSTFRVELPAVPSTSEGEETHVDESQDPAHRGRRGDDPSRAGSYAAA